MYCDGLCKNLNEKKHICNLTGEKLSFMRKGKRGSGFTIHEHDGICEQDKNENVEG